VGALFVYDRDAIGAGPLQQIQIAGSASTAGLGRFIGVPAYSPVTGLVYVSNPGPDALHFAHGMVALRPGPDCRLRLAWQRRVPTGTMTVSSPTVANGVVYFGTGGGDRVFAFDARPGVRCGTAVPACEARCSLRPWWSTAWSSRRRGSARRPARSSPSVPEFAVWRKDAGPCYR